MKGVDLSQFQFDYDLSWAAMFINADGTVYGRYGTQSAEGPDAFNSTASLEKAMLGVLALHAKYPKNKTALAAKRGVPKPYRTAIEMPGLENKNKFRQTTERNNCIHCHNIHDAENNQLHLTGKMTHEKLWRYPFPDNLGLSIDPKDGQRIAKVTPNSAAARAGLRPGQTLTHVNSQPIISIADIQWVLHNLSNDAELIRINITGSSRQHLIRTAPGWKKTDISWRGSLWNLHPRLRVWMPPATSQELLKLKLPADQHALKVKWINTGSKEGKAAHSAGLRQGDFIIAIDGKPLGKMTPQQFTAHVKLNYKSGQKLPLTLIRNGKRIQFKWPLQ
jgi:predicted metalloprotease with PDZ domain